ncbi:hypothetical protein NE865_07703 [Phthorimaea operculella]|nr:hypothetical protein NE865_07703 [Phthorimaea operculella]
MTPSFPYNGAKLRRDGVLNLYPFPRVGRAGPRSWQVPVSDFFIEEYEPMDKRQLYAFPRVGRAESSLRDLLQSDQLQASPIRRSDSPGMWFGPRLGRAVKSSEDELLKDTRMDSARNSNGLGMWFGPRVGRAAKTDENEMVQNYTNERSEPEQAETDTMERKKRQTKQL